MKNIGLIKNQGQKRKRRSSYRRKLPTTTSKDISPILDMAETRREIVNALVDPIQFQVGPIWSTTEPASAAEAEVVVGAPHDEFLEEFLWPESSLSSSYSWWLGFLSSLDCSGNNIIHDNDDQESTISGGSKMEIISLDQNDDEQSPSPLETYDWLSITAAEDEVE